MKTVKQRNMVNREMMLAIGDELQTLLHPIVNATKQADVEIRKVLTPKNVSGYEENGYAWRRIAEDESEGTGDTGSVESYPDIASIGDIGESSDIPSHGILSSDSGISLPGIVLSPAHTYTCTYRLID